MSRLMDAWNTIEQEKEVSSNKTLNVQDEKVAVQKIEQQATNKKKMGRPSATLDRTKSIRNVNIKMSSNDFIYCGLLAKELKKEGVCGGDVSSLIAYFIEESRKSNRELSKDANAIYEIQTKKRNIY